MYVCTYVDCRDPGSERLFVFLFTYVMRGTESSPWRSRKKIPFFFFFFFGMYVCIYVRMHCFFFYFLMFSFFLFLFFLCVGNFFFAFQSFDF